MSRTARVTYVRCSRDDDYLRSLEAVGLDVHVVDHDGDVAAALHGSGGVVLAGGPDVDPAHYGEDVHPANSLAGDVRDAFELDVARHCLREALPLLAICRGMQILNVAAGGTLIQDVPSQVSLALAHARDETFTTIAHAIEVQPDSHVARAVANGAPTTVNSRHHQAAKVVARPLVVTAIATDGIVEAIEAPALPFCVGVQWHPENFWRTGEFLPLFRAFAAACAIG